MNALTAWKLALQVGVGVGMWVGVWVGVATAQASPVFRCPPPPGSSSLAVYSDQPCPSGQRIEARDDRLPEQQRSAQSRAREESRWVDQMARQRRQEERALAAQQQRQVAVIDQPRVDISADTRAQAQREAELRRMSRPPPARRDVKPPAPVPPPAAAGTAPTATPGRL